MRSSELSLIISPGCGGGWEGAEADTSSISMGVQNVNLGFFLSLLKHISVNKVENSSCYLQFFEKKKMSLMQVAQVLIDPPLWQEKSKTSRERYVDSKYNSQPWAATGTGACRGSCWRELSLLSDPLCFISAAGCRLPACSFCLKLSNCGLFIAPVLAIT